MKDLFPVYYILPKPIQAIIEKYGEEQVLSVENIKKFQQELNEVGYEFDYGLGCIPFNLREL